jgi:CheY-like chemotaxis protein
MNDVASSGQSANPDGKGTGYTTDLCILIADGYADAANCLALLLRYLGADARACYSAPEALKAASADPPDAILSEICLPGMDGSEFVRRVRERVELQKTLLIAVTAWADWQSRRLAEEAGFDFFYMKPLDHASLQEILADVRWIKERTNSPGDTLPIRRQSRLNGLEERLKLN